MKILSIGTSTPTHSIDQKDAIQLAKTFCVPSKVSEKLLPIFYERSRIEKRGSVLLEKSDGQEKATTSFFQAITHDEDRGPSTEQRMKVYAEEARKLALDAVNQALKTAEVFPEDIHHVITVSCTGFEAPGVDIALIKGLRLNPNVHRTHVGFMGCHGLFNAMRIADAWVAKYPEQRVLICSVELCSLHLAYGDNPEQMVANALFADGSAALVVSGESPKPAWKFQASGSHLFPDSEGAMSWRIGDHGFEMTLSPEVPGLIGSYLRPWLEDWVAQQGFKLSEIASWALHPGGPKILETVEKTLDLSQGSAIASRSILANYGNMSSSTIGFILNHLQKDAHSLPCLALGFGPGLAAEAALFVSE